MAKLSKIQVSGFKSIKKADVPLDALTVLIGANGSGKSNLVSFFKMLHYMTTGRLQVFIGRAGGANSLLHYGAKQTPQMEFTLEIESDKEVNQYIVRLFHAAEDTLIFADELTIWHRTGDQRPPQETSIGTGHKESALGAAALRGNETASDIRYLVRKCHVFQFHDTSDTALIRQSGDIENNKFLNDNAGNLAAFLYYLQQAEPDYYKRIVSTIQQFASFFDDFVLEPSSLNDRMISLRWKDRDSGYEFGAHQLSDGTIRAMALATLLLQPEKDLPAVIVLDEPELGMHPYAITIVSSLIRQASRHAQIILATQSPFMLDQFEPEHVVVVDRRDRESVFTRLDPETLQDWLKEYAISELWEKNIFGGKPSR